MANNYTYCSNLPTIAKPFLNKRNFNYLIAAFFFFASPIVFGQTTIINSAGNGAFNNGSSLAANGWTSVSNATDAWALGQASNPGNNCAYISSDNGTTWSYSANNAVSHLYYEFTVPANQGKLNLSFDWKAGGEGATNSDADNLRVFLVPTYYFPTANNALTNTGATKLFGSGAVSEMYKLNSASWNTESVTFAALPGVTYRLVFSWKTDASSVTNPPATIDNVFLGSETPGEFISTASGNYSDISIWNNAAVPTAGDNVTISAGHTVLSDKANQFANNLKVDGVFGFAGTGGSFSNDFGIKGNLNVSATGVFNAWQSSNGKTITIGGNITNNGRVDASIGIGTSGKLIFNGLFPQTFGGSGLIGGTVSSTTTANTVNVINNLTIKNLNPSIPNIIIQFNDIKIKGTLEIDGARIDLGNKKITFGNYGAPAAGTLAPLNRNSGFLPGAKISRWITTTFSAPLTAATDATSTLNRFPFIDFSGNDRALYLFRTGTSGNTAGELAVTYTDGSGFTTGLVLDDGGYIVNDRFNGKWTLSTEGSNYASTNNHSLSTFAPNAIVTTAQTTRLMLLNSFVGTHQNGTATPSAQRIGLTTANLLAGDFYMGINNTNTSIVSAATGDWNATTTWVGGVVPTCTDDVVISANHVVAVSGLANAKNITISSTGTLKLDANTLTVGCTLNNNRLTNNGILIVNSGTLKVNGNLVSSLNSSFSQSGGAIIIDGNDNGIATNSVAAGTSLLRFDTSTLNIGGGSITIVDPHVAATATDAFTYNVAGANNFNITAGHTFIFGDGTSNQNGGNTSAGFRINTAANSSKFSFNNVTINGGNVGVNRFVSTLSSFGVNGDFQINSGSEFKDNAGIIYIAKNITNNGFYTATGTLYLGTFLNGVAGSSNNAQAISGSGTYQNAVVSASANFSNLSFNNTSTTGVTLSLPLSVSNNLAMLSGKIITSNTNILWLGTTTSAGNIIYPTSNLPAYIVGPFQRTIAANLNTNFVDFPMGINSFTPIGIAIESTAASVFKAETFDVNSGTADTSILNLANNKRWEVTKISGNFTNMNVRLGSDNLTNANIVVQAPTASGLYTNSLGNTASFSAANASYTNTIASMTPITSANFTGFFSYAKYNGCSGTPTPGNTNASDNLICMGETVALSMQNTIPGLGVSYQWQSSTDNITFTNISGAVTTALNVTPSLNTYYRCEVVCGGNTGYSNNTFIEITNNLKINNPTVVCEPNTIDITLPAITSGSSSNLVYTYFTNAAATTVLSNPSAITLAGTYYIKATNSITGCSDVKPVTVSLNAQPSIVISNPVAVCSTTSVNITTPAVTSGSTPGLTYYYYSDAAGTVTLSNPNSITTSGTYYIKGFNSNSCSDIEPVTVTINPLPNVVTTNPTTACSPNTVNITLPSITAGSTAGLTYTYFTNSTATTVLSNPNAINTSGTYYIKGTTAAGCEDIDAVTVTINSVGTPTGPSPQIINATTMAVIEQISVSYLGTITWYATLANANAGVNPLPAGHVLVDSTTYYCVQNLNGCTSTGVLPITVNVVLGAESFNVNELSFYPNPVNDILNIKYNQDITSVIVFDLSGRKIIEQKPNSNNLTINMQNWASSMYLIQLKSEEQETTLKVFKK